MDIGSIFLILSLLLFVIFFVARPFFERSAMPAAVSSQEHELSSLLAERERVLSALQELDFDFTLGKVPEEDYPIQRSVLLQRGANVLRRLDTLKPTVSPVSLVEEDTSEQDAFIEATLAARKSARTLTSNDGKGGNDELETLIAARRRARQEKSAGFCPKCGKPVMKSDRFCPKCGAALT